jgi:hypothetical protein
MGLAKGVATAHGQAGIAPDLQDPLPTLMPTCDPTGLLETFLARSSLWASLAP